jgi:thioredoxin-like negative regulator of GroEL
MKNIEGQPSMSRIQRLVLKTVAGCALFLFIPHPSSLILAEDVDWRADYNAARKEAAEKNLPIVLDFGFEDCKFCRKLDAVTFRDAEVIKRLNGKFVPLRIDIQKDPSLAEKLGLQMFPTVVFASPEGHILGKVEGYQEPGPFQENLDRVLDLVANPEWMKRDYDAASRAIGASDNARALALLKNVVQDGKDRPVQVKAKQLLQDLEQQAAGRLARARQLADKGETTEAIDTVTELVRVFAGTQAATDGGQMLTSLSRKPEIKDGQRSRRARELLAEAREDYRTQQYLLCLHRCDVLAATFGDLPEGVEAAQLAGEIKNNPERLRQAAEMAGEQLGGLYLSLAEACLKKGQPQQAMIWLERVVQTLPNTRQADAAQMRLAQLQGQPATRAVDFKKP